MKMKHRVIVMVLFMFFGAVNAQSISSEVVDFQLLQQPKEFIDANSRNFKVTVTPPYNLTAADVLRQAKEDYQQEVRNYSLAMTVPDRL